MRNYISILIAFVLAQAVAAGQDYYSGKSEISCEGQTYFIEDYSEYGEVYISNKANHMRDNLRYKKGSDPVVYYTYATGMGHFADVDTVLQRKLVKEVFTEEEIERYTNCPGKVIAHYIVDPDTGKVLEVRFSFQFNATPDRTLLSIPIERLQAMEKKLKEEMIMGISDELKEERQSYTLAIGYLFRAPTRKWKFLK